MKQTMVGRYELLCKIAAGGMAEVFLARQWGQGRFFRDVVIKRLFAHYAEHEQALRMFQDEARLLAELNHPNIPEVYDLGYSDGYWFMAMEYVPGARLADLCQAALDTRSPMPIATVIGLVIQVCAALHHAHELRDRQGQSLHIVHRDVTPYNLMVSPEAVVKLIDFGVAQTSARADTDAGAVRGTYAYMAPEQVRGRPLDRRADVFALGINLYELTTGTPLFRGSDVESMTAVVERQVPPPSSRVPNYPPDLEEIVMWALDRDPAARTPSAAHLLQSLDQFCLRQGLSTHPLAIAPYVRSLFPFVRPYGKYTHALTPLSEEELENRLLVHELSVLRATDEPTEDLATEIDERRVENGFLDDAETDVMESSKRRGARHGEREHLGLDAFDEDADVKPVVLLSPKTSPREGAFLGDLERRLEEDADLRED